MNLFGRSDGIHYITVNTAVYDEDRNDVTLYEYCADVGDYFVFLTLGNDTADDYLNIMYHKIEKATGIITYIQALDVGDVSTSGIANIKNYNGHLYVNFSYSGTYYYYDMDIAAGTGTTNSGTYTNGVDIDNTPLNYQGYKLRTSATEVVLNTVDYVKNKIRVDYE